jgi:CubicO group peptidase (beta-lactamase class C family)
MSFRRRISRSPGSGADGHTIGAAGLFLTTVSLALFGRLLLQRGDWRDKQLVSPRWIDSASRPQVSSASNRPDYNPGYGCGFWPCRHGAFRADGKDGQFVITLPRQDAVLAINSNEPRHYPILYAVWDEILPLYVNGRRSAPVSGGSLMSVVPHA